MTALPEGWRLYKIGEIAEVRTGKTPPRNDTDNYGTGYSFYRPADLRVGEVLAPASESVSELGARTIGVMPTHSLLVTCIGTLGKSGLTTAPSVCNQQINVILPTPAAEPRFLLHWSRTIGPWLEANSSATTIKIINKGRFEAAPIALPPLAEQRRIVAKIDALSARSKRARADLARVEALAARAKQAVLRTMFVDAAQDGWRPLVLGDLGEVVTGNTPPTSEKDRLYGGALAYFKPTDLDAGYRIEVAREGLSSEGAARARVLPAMSVLVTCIGTIGKTGLARVPCATNQQINAIVCDQEVVDPKWLYWRIIAADFQAAILASSSATTLPIINKSRFQSLQLLLPSQRAQSKMIVTIETAMARLDALAQEALRASALLDRFDQSLLARAFRGELVPQNPADEPASVLLDRIRAERAGADAPKRRGRSARAGG